MKCLSLWQPWATLLVHGRKRVETRGWAIGHRGPLLIHAAKKWDGELSSMCVREPFKDALESIGVFHPNPFLVPAGLAFGVIVGRVDVVDCYPTERVEVDEGILRAFAMPTVPPWLGINPTERAFGDYGPGRFAWLCDGFVAFKSPIPYRGAQGLFNVPDELVRDAR